MQQPRQLLFGTTGWASELAPAAVADYVSSLEPQSAGAKLVAAGQRLNLDRVAYLGIPQRSTPPAVDASWISETGAIPVRQSTIAETFLGPVKKLAAVAVLSRETAEHSSGESVIRQILAEDLSASLDATLFSNLAATSARPAGLLNGLSAAATAQREAVRRQFEVILMRLPLRLSALAVLMDYQTDSIGVRAILSIAWTTRAPNAVSFITGASW